MIRLGAYAINLLVRLGDAESTPVEYCHGDALHELEHHGLVEVRNDAATLTWQGIVHLRELRRELQR